jgi:hypothetical protein
MTRRTPLPFERIVTGRRRETHGWWPSTARIAQGFKGLLDAELLARRQRIPRPLPPEQIEALEMILAKIARIISGDPNHPDHWDDIAGYALLGKGETP